MVTVTSLVVANAFDRPHDQVLQTIGELLGGLPDKAWCNRHFQCRDLAGNPMYRLTRDAFVMLVATFISFTYKKARVESLYLNAFDILEGGGKPDAKAQLPDLPVRSTRLAAPNRNLISSRSSLPVYREPKVIQPSAMPPEQVAVSPSADVPSSLQLIPVFNGTIQNQTVRLCNARDLHAFLSVGCDFATWIKRRIAEYGFSEGADYLLLKIEEQLPSGLKHKTDYHLTLGMAKELGMIERNEKGRQIRRYFIECERHLLLGATKPAPVTAPANLIPGLNIGEDEFFLHVYNALGRENGKVTLLIQLVKMGGVDKWITATAQKIVVAANGKISNSSVHYNAKRLIAEGLIDHKSHQYYVFGEALRTRIKHPMLQNTAGMLALPDDPAKSDGAGHGDKATTLH